MKGKPKKRLRRRRQKPRRRRRGDPGGVRRVLSAVVLVAALLASGPAFAKPSRWCGWFARTLVAVDPGPAFNLACAWLHYGQPTTAHVGAMVVWCSRGHHHVGKITAIDANGNPVVTSGNDSGRVRSRVRSLAGAAFRE